MTTNQLALYNIALASVGERALDSLVENRESRKQLDVIWNAGLGAINYFLEQGLWNHAMRESSSTAGSTGGFNFYYIHNRPTDFVRLSAISENPNFSMPAVRYEFQASAILSDSTPIYLRYVSDSSTAGNDLTLWPETFTRWAGHWLGTQIAPFSITTKDRDLRIRELEKRANRLLVDARSKDAQQEPTRFPPLGTWARARSGRRGGDRGLRNNLTE